jgi:integrase
VPAADAVRVIDCCPNGWWKLLVALARFGGLRIPSEAFPLMWADVDWERNRLTVPSPKTEGHGKPHRVIPLFPLLRPHLEAAFDGRPRGTCSCSPKCTAGGRTGSGDGAGRTCGPHSAR